ncbi:keratin-associated protein 14-like [Marmota flaviventris]|uniref:keratin-associated protein 14-like n=1 Tax=Marmota flaviventris TaxID=93162 RepID=UPI003A8B33F3
MSSNCCSGSYSSRSFGGYLQQQDSSCGSSCPSSAFYCPVLQTPVTHQLGSSLSSGCQETCCDPTSCQTSCGVSKPCQTSCYRQRSSTFCSPCHTTFSGSLGFGSRGFQSVGCGFGSRGFQSVGCAPHTFSSLNYGSNFYRPSYFSSRSCQSASYQLPCGSGFY